MKIETITLKNDQTIALGKISILVGANNVGKSQTLRDIQQKMQVGKASKSVLLKEIVFEKPASFEDLLVNLKVADSTHNSLGELFVLKRSGFFTLKTLCNVLIISKLKV